MRFHLVQRGTVHPGRSGAFLVTNDWDDFGFKTLFRLYVFDRESQRTEIGYVKIGRSGMAAPARTQLQDEFDSLDPGFFSVGQDDEYYANLSLLGTDIREEVLRALNDVAAAPALFEQVREEEVMSTSLLRDVAPETVRGQFRRMASGGKRLSAYSFSYQAPEEGSPVLSFKVEPESEPPTNVHVIIGRNGVGKTRTLQLLSRAFRNSEALEADVGKIAIDETRGSEGFAGLVSVAFSAFDPFDPIDLPSTSANDGRYVYVGLKQRTSGSDEEPEDFVPSASKLAVQFAQSLAKCSRGPRRGRWLSAVGVLESDPMIATASIRELIDADDQSGAAISAFDQMSSGHKVVLLSITRLIEVVEERTLVLFDEPESHLHPPLLSALVRALSELMLDRNGVAIIATHSPVVLQEVPRSCVWTIRRSGSEVRAERPSSETFGENVGVLTREVFGLEVSRSGFHRLVTDAVDAGLTYDQVTDRFNDQLGGEARSIARSLTARRHGQD